jgi:hypothetical protein
MPVVGNNSRSLLNGLSDFWLRFFRDLPDLEALYEGAEIMLGQTYLNLLSDVLNTSVDETPIFKKEYYRLLTIREDDLICRDSGIPNDLQYQLATPVLYGSLPYLQNKVFEPTVGYEQGLDYTLLDQSIVFKVDPTDPVLAGIANRDIDISVAGTFASGVDWVGAGVQKGDVLVANRDYDMTIEDAPPGTVRFTIIKATADALVLKAGTDLPTTLTGFSWRLERTLTTGVLKTGMPDQAAFTGAFTATSVYRVRQLSLWVVDGLVDDERLYYVYGHYFGDKQPSSETYRAFIRGLMQLYVFGPNIARIESALNVMAALPVIRDDGEVLLGYDNGLDDNNTDGALAGQIFQAASASFQTEDAGGYIEVTDAINAANVGVWQILSVVNPTTVLLVQSGFVSETGLTWEFSRTDLQTVTTSAGTYTYPRRIPMREDVVDPGNFGVLTFEAFEALTTAITVTDYIQDPEWWLNITIPTTILPRPNPGDRIASPQLLPNVIGPTSEWSIGDPGFYIGADEDGNVNGSEFHHRAAFILMDRFLKTHILAVNINRYVDLTGKLIQDMRQVLYDLKPAHSMLYFQPVTEFTDLMTITEEELDVLPKMNIVPDVFTQIDNTYVIGSSWLIGDGWKFTTTSGGAVTIGTGTGFSAVAVGGADPGIQPTSPSTEPIGYYIDRPLYVNPRAP